MLSNTPEAPAALVTGASRRIGAAIARALHSKGYNLAIHYDRSKDEALALCRELARSRDNSATVFQADLRSEGDILKLAKEVTERWQRLEVVVNNASVFYPTPLEACNLDQWNDLLDCNLRGPFLLLQALATPLRQNRGRVVNIVDIYARQPLKDYSVYCIAKAGLAALTRCLALELAPGVRVNGIAPGAILWPDGPARMSADAQNSLMKEIPLGRLGTVEEIAALAAFLTDGSGYITGQIIAIDGGLGLKGNSA